MIVIRHPLRGIFGGLLLGIGLALILVQLGFVPIGSATVVVVVLLAVVLGLLVAVAAPPRR
jgi:hypothetical protein